MGDAKRRKQLGRNLRWFDRFFQIEPQQLTDTDFFPSQFCFLGRYRFGFCYDWASVQTPQDSTVDLQLFLEWNIFRYLSGYSNLIYLDGNNCIILEVYRKNDCVWMTTEAEVALDLMTRNYNLGKSVTFLSASSPSAKSPLAGECFGVNLEPNARDGIPINYLRPDDVADCIRSIRSIRNIALYNNSFLPHPSEYVPVRHPQAVDLFGGSAQENRLGYMIGATPFSQAL